LTEWDPQQQDEHTRDCGDNTETQREPLRHTLVKNVPRVQAESGGDHHRHREAVQPQSNEQRGESTYEHSAILAHHWILNP
jgi:hypothetical protein